MIKVYETISVRLEDVNDLIIENVCIEFIRNDRRVSVLLNGIDRTHILKWVVPGRMFVPLKIFPSKLALFFNENEYRSIPPLFLKGIQGKDHFQNIMLFGDASLIEEVNRLPIFKTSTELEVSLPHSSTKNNTVYQPIIIEKKDQKKVFELLTAMIRKRLYFKER